MKSEPNYIFQSNFNKQQQVMTDYLIILHFLPNSIHYSFHVPLHWNINRLRKFIVTSFEEDINFLKYTIIYKARPLIDDSVLLKDLFCSSINHIQIVLKDQDTDKDQSNNSRTNIFKSREFKEIEEEVLSSYLAAINDSDSHDVDYNSFPFAQKNLAQRIEIVNSQNTLEQLRAIEQDSIEHFPIKDYFHMETIFKIFIFVILFLNQFREWNCPLIVVSLSIYYWYVIANLIKDHYTKKIDNITFTPEEINEIEKEYNNKMVNDNHFQNHQTDKRNDTIERFNDHLYYPYSYIFALLFEVVSSFLYSLFPTWYENFDLNNPIHYESNSNNTNEEEADQLRANNNIDSKNSINDSNSQQQEGTVISREVKIFSSNNSEKVNVPSSSMMNNSEYHHRLFTFFRPNDNKTENEYVFSEKDNIDNISNNESLLEFQRLKNETEDEEDKKNK